MADKIAIKDVGQGILVKYKDQGDGTHAEVFAPSGLSGTSFPEIIATPWNPFALTGASPGSALNMTEIDWSQPPYAGINAFRLTGRTANNATLPGTGRTFSINYSWSDVPISPANANTIPLILAQRRTVLGPFDIPNVTSGETHGGGVRAWDFSQGILLPQAQYLYLSVDKTAFDASASVNLTLRLTRVMA